MKFAQKWIKFKRRITFKQYRIIAINDLYFLQYKSILTLFSWEFAYHGAGFGEKVKENLITDMEAWGDKFVLIEAKQ